MDISSRTFPLILIFVLVGILLLQFVTSDKNAPMIDSETCELYLQDSQINAKKYLNEFKDHIF